MNPSIFGVIGPAFLIRFLHYGRKSYKHRSLRLKLRRKLLEEPVCGAILGAAGLSASKLC